MSFDEACIYFAFCEQVVGDNVQADRYGCFDWFDDKLAQSPFHSVYRFCSVGLMNNELTHHRVIICRDGISLINVCIDSDAGAARRDVFCNGAGAGCEIIFRVLSVDSAFNGAAGVLDFTLA